MKSFLFFGLLLFLAARARGDTAVELGRRVYIREGCIGCHSQYIRPRVPSDVQMWGPAAPQRQRGGAMPLYGSRRQGPDLENVGNRRSPEWQRWHLQDPRVLVPGSRMPSYAYLFAGTTQDGDDLLAYLVSLGDETFSARSKEISRWIPIESKVVPQAETRKTFRELCAVCHGQDGNGDGPLGLKLSARPPSFRNRAWRHIDPNTASTSLARVIKFGIAGTNMPGHEYLSDATIVGLANHVLSIHNSREVQP